MIGLFKSIFSENSNDELKTLVQNDAFLVDVRTPQEFAEGHVPGSVNIPLDEVSNQVSKFKNKTNIIVFCRSGNRSGQAKTILKQNGFTNVTNGGTWKNIKTLVDGK